MLTESQITKLRDAEEKRSAEKSTMRMIYFDIETLPFQSNVSIQGIGAIYKKKKRFRTFYQTMLDTDRVKPELLRKFRIRSIQVACNTKEILQDFYNWMTRETGNEDIVLVSETFLLKREQMISISYRWHIMQAILMQDTCSLISLLMVLIWKRSRTEFISMIALT